MVKDKIPKTSETIAARRAARLAEKIKKAKSRLAFTPAWWSNGATDFFSLVLLSALNFYLIYPFFGKPAVATTFSGPVIPLMARIIEFFGIPITYAYQIVNIAFFLAFPISFYLFIKLVSGRKLVALLATLFASLPVYPFVKVRIESAFFAVEAPHIASLTIMPLALFGLLAFLRRGGAKNLILAGVSSALVALTSPFGFITYGLFSAVTAFSEMLLGHGRLKLFRFLVVFVLAAGLSSFWYNPAFFAWMVAGPMGEEIRQTAAKLLPISFFLIPVLGAFGFLLFDRKSDLQAVFLASFYTLFFGIIVLAGGGFFPSHPSRYTPEFGISLSFLLAIFITRLTDFLRFQKKFKLFKWNNQMLANIALLLIFLLLILATILGRGRFGVGVENILGTWTKVSKGEIWMAKGQFSGFHSYLGYSITGITISLLAFLGIRSISEKRLLP